MRGTIPRILMLCLLPACSAKSATTGGKPVVELTFSASKNTVTVFDDGRVLAGEQEVRLRNDARKQLGTIRASLVENLSDGVSYVVPALERVDVVAFDTDTRVERIGYVERCGANADPGDLTESVAQLVTLLAAAGYDRCAGTSKLLIGARWSAHDLRLYEDGTFAHEYGGSRTRGALPRKKRLEVRRLANSLRDARGGEPVSSIPPGIDEVKLTLPRGHQKQRLIAYLPDCSGSAKASDVDGYSPQLEQKVTRLFAVLKAGGFDRCAD
ncbi:MAG TPA: hypothetical protein VGQ76_13740 [Thermoanaerobaculia bacterium]|nr:hypothetical protein [Thermoanaerobaculia bacterium]